MKGHPLRTLLVMAHLGIGLVMAGFGPALAQGDGWERYRDPELGYTIDLPVGAFKVVATDPPVTRLRQDDSDTQLEVYGGYNVDALTIAEFIDLLSRADRIAEITYRTGGATWFVISGYYRRDDSVDPELIFYAKFMFSADLERFSAFEISYPRAHRERLDPVIEALEASLRAPPSG